MRLDLFLSKVGLIKRRTVAKELADNGLIKINSQPGKAGKEINEGDIIAVGGKRAFVVEVKKVPGGSVKKEARQDYFKILENSTGPEEA
jgi:ribosomal 50S subunit-recycling heat shock protein